MLNVRKVDVMELCMAPAEIQKWRLYIMTCWAALVLARVSSIAAQLIEAYFQNNAMLRQLCRSHITKVRCPSASVPAAIQQLNQRRLTTKPAAGRTASLDDDASFSEWRTIYSLPSIRLVAAFNKLKIYQAALTAAGAPIAFALGQAGHVATDALGIYSAIGVSGLITLTLASYAATNLVGFIYINEQQDMLKLAYVDFWGRRVETLVETDDLLPSWERGSTSRLRFVLSITLRSDAQRRYKLLNRFGNIADRQLFEGLFGD
ncbi:transmembrane protein 186 [Drosophila obscura]|uniref:transmembrane protein 186 n=1 Tax=Drosophila obscura TaxID=7282 RepID=UPI001BB0D9F5|nr:transmembrane protein 186 [Drosophila obscura]XP_041448768.1 transmembrane protein 186 [Drosophila obscura]